MCNTSFQHNFKQGNHFLGLICLIYKLCMAKAIFKDIFNWMRIPENHSHWSVTWMFIWKWNNSVLLLKMQPTLVIWIIQAFYEYLNDNNSLLWLKELYKNNFGNLTDFRFVSLSFGNKITSLQFFFSYQHQNILFFRMIQLICVCHKQNIGRRDLDNLITATSSLACLASWLGAAPFNIHESMWT